MIFNCLGYAGNRNYIFIADFMQLPLDAVRHMVFYAMDTIEQEISYYKKHKEEFIILHADKHIVIKGMQVIGVYQTNSEAFAQTIKDHEKGTFIIEHPVDIKLKSYLLKR